MNSYQRSQQKKLGLKIISLEAEKMPERVYQIDRFKYLLNFVKGKRITKDGK